jgi:hypothetical protein
MKKINKKCANCNEIIKGAITLYSFHDGYDICHRREVNSSKCYELNNNDVLCLTCRDLYLEEKREIEERFYKSMIKLKKKYSGGK